MKNRGTTTIIVSLTLSLILLGTLSYGFVLGASQGRKALDQILGEVRMSLMVTDSLSDTGRNELEKLIARNAEVERTVFISKDQARAEFESSIGQQMKLGVNLPASIEVYYRGGSAVTARLLSKFTKYEQVREVVCNPTIAHKRDLFENSLVSMITILTTFVILVVVVLLYFVVCGWVRRAVVDRRTLVGQSFSLGAICGVLSGVVLILADQYLGIRFPDFALGMGQTLLVASMMIFAGVVLSTLFTYMSIKTLQR